MGANDGEAADHAVQTEYLRRQLNALRAGPAARWRRFRLLQVTCGHCGDVLLEVMDTDPYPVVLTRGTAPNASEPPPIDPTREQIAEYARSRHRPIRQGSDWRFFPLRAEPSAEYERTKFHSTCRCRQAHLTLGYVNEGLRSGAARRVYPRHDTPRQRPPKPTQ